MLGELARQQADQHPVEGDGRISSLHHLLALLMLPGAPGAGRLLGELGVDYGDVVRRIEEEGARRVARCSTASSVPRPDLGGYDARQGRCEASQQEAAGPGGPPRQLSTGGTVCVVCFVTTGSRSPCSRCS